MERSKYTAKRLLSQQFRFQAAPLEEYSITYGHEHADYMTLRAGQFSRPSGKLLRTISFNTLFVDERYVWPRHPGTREPDQRNPRTDREYSGYRTWLTFDHKRYRLPMAYKEQLERIMDSGTPFWLTVANPRMWGNKGKHPDLKMLATLRTFTATERAGEPDARYMDLAFTEYEVPGLKRKAQGNGGSGGGGHSIDEGRPPSLAGHKPSKERPQAHRVMVSSSSTDGEPAYVVDLTHTKYFGSPSKVTLGDLAQEYYASRSEARKIAQANGLDWPHSRPLVLYVDERNNGRNLTLRIPAS
jgi:hypothetical protein